MTPLNSVGSGVQPLHVPGKAWQFACNRSLLAGAQIGAHFQMQ